MCSYLNHRRLVCLKKVVFFRNHYELELRKRCSIISDILIIIFMFFNEEKSTASLKHICFKLAVNFSTLSHHIPLELTSECLKKLAIVGQEQDLTTTNHKVLETQN